MELLEQGRGVLLSQVLNIRVGVDDVRAHAPALAERLMTIHRELESAASDRQRLALERENVIAQIRAVEGLENFLEPPCIADVRAAVAGRTIVIVNLSRYRCDALVVTSAAARLVPLPDLTMDDAVARAEDLTRATDRDASLLATLAWLWDTVVEPVLDAGVASRDLHVWWMPTGPLSLLPLHAAGHHTEAGDDTRSALHRVVSSYTPTVRSLRTTGSGSSTTPVVVSMAHTGGRGALPRATGETELVRRLFGHAVVVPPERATRAGVLACLTDADWIHFACHATADAARPSDSHFVLQDGPLRVREIVGRHRQAALAYLSACTTARGSVRLPDENIHICAAFQLAGFTAVIGTLWEIPDSVAARATDYTYAALPSGSAARAVNEAARLLRDRYRAHPSAWAGIVHIGADWSITGPSRRVRSNGQDPP